MWTEGKTFFSKELVVGVVDPGHVPGDRAGGWVKVRPAPIQHSTDHVPEVPRGPPYADAEDVDTAPHRVQSDLGSSRPGHPLIGPDRPQGSRLLHDDHSGSRHLGHHPRSGYQARGLRAERQHRPER